MKPARLLVFALLVCACPQLFAQTMQTVTVSPATAAFGSVTEGTASTAIRVTLTNLAPKTLNFTSPVEITGPDAADFTIASTTCGMPVSGNGGVCRTMVVFTPSKSGTEIASLHFAENGNPATMSAALSGTGVGAPPPVSVAVSPATVAFGSVTGGTASTAIRVTLTNLAPKTLDFTSPVKITGPNAADFSIATTTCGMPVSGNGGVCRTMVVFTPSKAGPESASLNFAENGNPQMISAMLTGTGVPMVTVSPTTVSFGTVMESMSSTAIQVTLTNLAPKTLDFTSPVAITGPNAADFSIVNTTCGMPVSGNGGVCRTMVAFTPSTAGPKMASLTYAENKAPSTISAMLTGTGVGAPPPPSVTVSPATVLFGNVAEGTASTAIRVTLTNLAPKTLDFTSPLKITGPNAADFTIASTTCGMPVSGNGGVCRTMMVFTPSTAGQESASLSFAENGNPSAISAVLTGTGMAHAAKPTPLISITFDDGFASAYYLGLPLVEAAGFKCTEFIITRALDTPTYVTSAQVLDEEARGHEIAAHTRTHPHLSTLTQAQQQDEIEGSKEDLTALLGHAPQNFAYPYGDFSTTTLTLVQQDGLASARSINATSITQNTTTTDRFQLYALGLFSSTTINDVESWIDMAQTNKTWLILVIHRVDEQGNYLSISHQFLQQVLTYIQQKGLPVVTVSQGLSKLGLVPSP